MTPDGMKGGQGRSDDDVRNGGIMFGVGCLIVLAYVVWGLVT